MSDQRTSCINNIVSGRSPFLPIPIGGAVRCDHDAPGTDVGGIKRSFANALCAQAFAYYRVVDQLPQDSEWLIGGDLLRLGDGVTHAKTGSEMFS